MKKMTDIRVNGNFRRNMATMVWLADPKNNLDKVRADLRKRISDLYGIDPYYDVDFEDDEYTSKW
jgi:hypothetical protein